MGSPCAPTSVLEDINYRERSCSNLPNELGSLKARELAEAGFYNNIPDGSLKCYKCGFSISSQHVTSIQQIQHDHAQRTPGCSEAQNQFERKPVVEGAVALPCKSGLKPSQMSIAESSSSSSQDSSGASTPTVVSKPRFVQCKGFHSFDSLRYERERLSTFIDWPIDWLSPESLAKDGFYYLRDKDYCSCVFCRGIVGAWELGDVPHQEHQRHFPKCPFVRGHPVGNVPLTQGDLLASLPAVGPLNTNCDQNGGIKSSIKCDCKKILSPSSPKEECSPAHSPKHNHPCPHALTGLPEYAGPKRKEFLTIESRIKSYKNWPRGVKQQPAQLAEAGFFYCGLSDHVRCYHCGQGLRNWEENDEPWVEHARWYPNCHYVLLSKGIEFIDQVRRENPPFFKCNSGKNGTDSCRGAETSDLAHQASTSPYVSHSYSADVRSNYRVHITDEQLDVLMDLDVQRAVLEMGFARPAVKRALRYKIEETGVPFFNLETCIERVLACSEESNANDEAHRQQEAKLAAYQREREDRIHQSHEDSLLREVNNISTTTAAVERTSQSEGEDVVNTQRIERLSSLMPSAASPPRGSRTPIITSPVMPPRRFNAAVSNLISDETSSQGSSTQSNSSLSDDVQSLDRTFDTSQLEEYFMEHESMEPVERVVQFLNESARDAASNNTNSTHTSPVNEAFNDTSTPRASPIPRSMDFTTGSEPEIISSSGMDVNVLTSLTPPLSQSPSLPPSSPSSSSSTMSLAADPISLEMLRQVDRVISKADATQKHVRRNLSNCSAKSSTSSKSSVCNLENCELMAVEAGGSSDGEALSLEEQLLKSEQKVRNLTEQVERLREGRLCKICMDADLSVVLLPCTHMATCSNCTLALSTCPICRSSIKHVIRPNVVA